MSAEPNMGATNAEEMRQKIAELRRQMPKMRLRDVVKAWRVRRARRLIAQVDGPVQPLNIGVLKKELEGLAFGMRCLMVQGGHKVKPQGMSDDEILKRGDDTAALVANVQLMVRCAEDVLFRHGYIAEYQGQLRAVEAKLNEMTAGPPPSTTELAALQALLSRKAGTNGGSQDDIPGAGGQSERTVDQEGLRDHRGEGAEGR